MDTAMAPRLQDAFRLPGAFLKRMYEGALIVMPNAGSVAIPYNC
jgi:hypothetical protein